MTTRLTEAELKTLEDQECYDHACAVCRNKNRRLFLHIRALESDLDAARREARAARRYIDEGVAVECNRTPGDTATTADIADEYRAARAANPIEPRP